MTIPWRHRLPTPEEIGAHAQLYPVPSTWRKEPHGLWLRHYPPIVLPVFTALGFIDREIYWDYDRVSRWRGGETNSSKWLPCTADGIPVCFLEVR